MTWMEKMNTDEHNLRCMIYDMRFAAGIEALINSRVNSKPTARNERGSLEARDRLVAYSPCAAQNFKLNIYHSILKFNYHV